MNNCISSNRQGHGRLSLLFIIFTFLFTSVTCNSSGSSSSSSSFHIHQVTSCLTEHGVGNFTTFPSATGRSGTGRDDPHHLFRSGEDDALYYTLLNFSIQNLRFSGPSIPKPAAIILPETLDQLVDTVSCCREGRWEIRVRCGGHSYEGTSSVATDGDPFVIIDMMNLDGVEVDLRDETAWVEGGATLGKTYSAIAEASHLHGFSAGSCPTVGVGGHIGGGGFGLLSRKHGLAADNVVDALLVDSSGRVLDRNSMGEDVFWAIRGGGGGVWGIVYSWKIKLLKVPNTVTGFIVNRRGTAAHLAELVNKWQHIAPSLDDNFYLSGFIGAGLPEAKGAPGISVTFKGLVLGPRNRAISILNRVFPELGVAEEDCHEMSWIESILFFSGLGDGSSLSDLRNRYSKDKLYFKAKSDYVRSTIPMSGIELAFDTLAREPKGYVILDPYGGIMDNISSDAIAFPHRKGNLFTIQYLVEWHEADDGRSRDYIEWIRGFYDSMTPHVSETPRAAYINYVDLDLGVMGRAIKTTNSALNRRDSSTAPDFEDGDECGEGGGAANVDAARMWGEKYFLGNYERLVKAKTLIDPDNVFRNQQGIPPMPNRLNLIKCDQRRRQSST